MVPPSNDPPLPPGSSPRENLEALRRRAERAADVLNGMNASAGPPPTTLPAPVSSPPPTPPSPAVPDPPSGASGGQKVWMGLGLALMTGLGTLPLLFLLWIVGVVFGVVVIAEALERTRGLAPSTYGGAFWLAVAFVVVLVLVEVITWFTPRREGERAGGCLAALLTRPLAAVLLLLLPCTLLVRCDLGGTDVPDIITTTALLCVLGYGLFVLPIAFVSLALRFARWLWRVGQRSSFGSGLVAGVGTVVGALLPTCLVCAPADPEADEEGERIGAAVERGAKILADDIDRRGLVEGSLTALTVTATVIPGTTGPWITPEPAIPLESRLRTCVAKFTAADRRTATVEVAVRWLVSNRNADRDTANAVAYDTVFKVCSRHAREAVDGDLVQYFWAAVKKNYCKDHGRNPLARCSSFDTLDARCDVGLPYATSGEIDAVVDLRARLCFLEDRDRDIVLRDFAGETSQQIAEALGSGMTAANVRKRLERAYKKMAVN
jgi:DNA-directed RNA polymerase specialized sigma24 family protein